MLNILNAQRSEMGLLHTHRWRAKAHIQPCIGLADQETQLMHTAVSNSISLGDFSRIVPHSTSDTLASAIDASMPPPCAMANVLPQCFATRDMWVFQVLQSTDKNAVIQAVVSDEFEHNHCWDMSQLTGAFPHSPIACFYAFHCATIDLIARAESTFHHTILQEEGIGRHVAPIKDALLRAMSPSIQNAADIVDVFLCKYLLPSIQCVEMQLLPSSATPPRLALAVGWTITANRFHWRIHAPDVTTSIGEMHKAQQALVVQLNATCEVREYAIFRSPNTTAPRRSTNCGINVVRAVWEDIVVLDHTSAPRRFVALPGRSSLYICSNPAHFLVYQTHPMLKENTTNSSKGSRSDDTVSLFSDGAAPISIAKPMLNLLKTNLFYPKRGANAKQSPQSDLDVALAQIVTRKQQIACFKCMDCVFVHPKGSSRAMRLAPIVLLNGGSSPHTPWFHMLGIHPQQDSVLHSFGSGIFEPLSGGEGAFMRAYISIQKQPAAPMCRATQIAEKQFAVAVWMLRTASMRAEEREVSPPHTTMVDLFLSKGGRGSAVSSVQSAAAAAFAAASTSHDTPEERKTIRIGWHMHRSALSRLEVMLNQQVTLMETCVVPLRCGGVRSNIVSLPEGVHGIPPMSGKGAVGVTGAQLVTKNGRCTHLNVFLRDVDTRQLFGSVPGAADGAATDGAATATMPLESSCIVNVYPSSCGVTGKKRKDVANEEEAARVFARVYVEKCAIARLPQLLTDVLRMRELIIKDGCRKK